MKFSEIKDLVPSEMKQRINAKKNELFDLKMSHALGKLANPLEVKAARRDVARLITALNQKNAEKKES